VLASAASRGSAQKHTRKESLQPLVADAGQNVSTTAASTCC